MCEHLISYNCVITNESSGPEVPQGVVVTMLDCEIVVIEFKLHACYNIHFWSNTLGKGIKPSYHPHLWVK